MHRRHEFRASQIMVDRAKSHEKIEIVGRRMVEEVLGVEQRQADGVLLRSVETDETVEHPTDGLFVAIGHDPTTTPLPRLARITTRTGYPRHERARRPRRTSPASRRGRRLGSRLPAGDHGRRLGCAAALDAERFLAEAEGHPEAALTARARARRPRLAHVPFFICPNCKNRSIDDDGRQGLLRQAVSCERCGFGFLFEIRDDHYPAPTAGLVACDRAGRILAAGRGVFELTGYRAGADGQGRGRRLRAGRLRGGQEPDRLRARGGTAPR